MKIRETGDPDQLTTRSGGGCTSLFGLPFLLAGLAVWVLPAVLPQGGGDPPPLLFTIPFGAVFVAVGSALVFGRSGLLIDRREKIITKWWGLLVPMKKKLFDVNDFAKISLSKEIRRSSSSSGGSSSYTVFPVRIVGADEKLNIEESRDYREARRAGEALAAFLSFSLTDSSSGTSVTREASELDESIRDRARRTGEVVELPDQPAGMKTRVQIDAGSVHLETPPAGFGLESIVMMLVGLIVPGVVATIFLPRILKDETMPRTVRTVFLAFIGVFMAVPLLAMFGRGLSKALRRATITVTPDVLQVTVKGLIFGKTTEIPADEIEELELAGGLAASVSTEQVPAFLQKLVATKGGISARSDRTSITFCRNLPPAEREWIYAVIKNMLTL